MQKEMNPTMTQSSLHNQPAARRKPSDVWVRRTIRCFVQQTASSTTVPVDLGRVMTVYGLTGTTSLKSRILGIKAWNMTKASTNTNFIQISTDPNVTTSGVVMNAQDVGSATHIAGVGVNIPDLLAKANSATATSTTVVCTLSGYPDGINPLSDIQTFCIDVNFAIQPV